MSQCYFKLLHSHLVNNLGYVDLPKYVDLNGLTEKQIGLVCDALYNNKKISLTQRDIFGKINHQVK